MRHIREGRVLPAWLVMLLLLSGCGEADPLPEQQCRSLDARNSVLKIFSDDEHNALLNFALKNSNLFGAAMDAESPETEKFAIFDRARKSAVYSLGGTILLKSSDKATREITCVAVLSVTVLDTRAEKEIEFRVKQTADSLPLVSVNPFRFKVQPF